MSSLAITTNSDLLLVWESLFTPISTVPRGMGLDDIVFPISIDSAWIHNTAANLFTYTVWATLEYLDFYHT